MIGNTLKYQILFSTLFLALVGYATSVSAVAIFLLTLLVFTLPGVPLAQKFCQGFGSANQIIFAVVIGIPLSSAICALLGYFFGFNALLFVLVLVLGSLPFLRTAIKSIARAPSAGKTDPFFFLVLGLVLSMLAYSYSNFGRLTSSGLMFKDLYSTDLLHHMSVFRHLHNGLPTANPYFSGIAWHYYWLSHFLPATVYAISGFSIEPMHIMLLTLCLNTTLFLKVLHTFLSSSFINRATVCSLLVISVLAYGYNDLYVIFKNTVSLLPADVVKSAGLNYLIDDAYGGSFTGYSHGWFRNFLVEPHSTLALTLSFLFVTLKIHRRPDGIRSNIFMGSLLGFILAFDAFVGVIMVAWAFIDFIAEQRKVSSGLRDYLPGLAAFVPVLLTLLFLFLLGVIAPGGSGLTFKPFVKMLVLSPVYFFIDFGPQMIFAVLGAFHLNKNRELLKDYRPFLTLVAVALFFMFFVNIKDIGSTQMFRKAGMVVRLPMLVYAGIFLDNISAQSTRLWLMVLLCVIVAVPTPFLDIYHLGTADAASHPSYVRHDDVEACRWIKNNLPVSAIVQDFPADTTPIFAFGERKVCLGDWEHAKSGGASPVRLKERIDKIKQIYSNADPLIAYKMSRELKIDYLYVNQRCVELFSPGTSKFKQSNLFQEVYHNGEVVIYMLVK